MMKLLLENWKRYVTESKQASAGRIYDLVFDIKSEVYNRALKAPKFFTPEQAEIESAKVFDEMKAKGLIDDFDSYEQFAIAFTNIPREED